MAEATLGSQWVGPVRCLNNRTKICPQTGVLAFKKIVKKFMQKNRTIPWEKTLIMGLLLWCFGRCTHPNIKLMGGGKPRRIPCPKKGGDERDGAVVLKAPFWQWHAHF